MHISMYWVGRMELPLPTETAMHDIAPARPTTLATYSCHWTKGSSYCKFKARREITWYIQIQDIGTSHQCTLVLLYSCHWTKDSAYSKLVNHTFKTDPEQVQLTLPSLEMYHLTSSLVSLWTSGPQDYLLLALFPGPSHLQYLITWSMQTWRGKAWEIWSHEHLSKHGE